MLWSQTRRLFPCRCFTIGALTVFAQPGQYLYTGSKTNITLNPGTYIITAYGAQGGYGAGGGGGLGAGMSAKFSFAEVTTLTLLVGGAGGGYIRPGGGGGAGGGGGGSFVVNGSTPLVIAGGGGGGGAATGGGAGVTNSNGSGGGAGGDAYGGGGGGGFLGGGADGSGGTGYIAVAAGGGGSGFLSGGGGGSGTEFAGSGGYGGGGGGGYVYPGGSGGGGGGCSGGVGGNGSADSGGGGGGSIIDSSAVAVLTRLSGVASPGGSPHGEIIITYPPALTGPPAHITASTGGTATFTADISGSPPFKYQWLFNGTNISGATNAQLSLANVSTTDLGFYSVTITNFAGSVTSAPAGLFIADLKWLAGLIVTGPAGTNFGLQATADLVTGGPWMTLTNISLPARPYIYIDYRSPTNPRQFYRLAATNMVANPATLDLKRFAGLVIQWPAGTNYDLQSLPVSGNVTNWTTLANFGQAAQPYIYGRLQFSDESANLPHRAGTGLQHPAHQGREPPFPAARRFSPLVYPARRRFFINGRSTGQTLPAPPIFP